MRGRSERSDRPAHGGCALPLLLALAVAACGAEAGPDADPDAASESRVEAAGRATGDERAGTGATTRSAADHPPTGHRADPSTWPTYGGDLGQTRYSPLAEIHADNVNRLEVAWRHRTGMRGIFEATPLVVDGALYVTTPGVGGVQKVLRLDAATGEPAWEASLRLGTTRPHPAPVNRGAAYWPGPERDLVIVGTLDARLVALEAESGRVAWERRTGDPAEGWQHKQAPVVWEELVITGAAASPHGLRGRVRAFDAATGEPRWTWHSIPSPGEGGWWGEWRETAPGTELPLGRDLEAERADSARHADAWRRGGAVVWTTPTVDAARGLLFVGTSNPAPELTDAARPGDNLWSVSVCALRARTGETVWCRQMIPHDVWGLDAASPPVLFRMEHEGKEVDAVGHFSKLGVFFAWERESGRPLTVSEPYVPHENVLARPRPGAPVRMAPGLYGGTEWSPAAFHPGTGWLYAANVHWPGTYRIRPGGATGFDLAPASESWGNVVAVDPATGRVAWEARTPRPMVGGVLATAGNLVFAGRLDDAFAAWHAVTGEELWSGPTPHGCASAPATFRAGGRQLVAVACGGHFLGGGRGDVLLAFALPEEVPDGER